MTISVRALICAVAFSAVANPWVLADRDIEENHPHESGPHHHSFRTQAPDNTSEFVINYYIHRDADESHDEADVTVPAMTTNQILGIRRAAEIWNRDAALVTLNEVANNFRGQYSRSPQQ